MANAKELRKQIGSIKNTQKITSAMEMVAASKMRKSQERMARGRPYSDHMKDVIGHVANASPEYRHGILLPDHGYVADPHRLTNVLAETFVRDGGKIMRSAVSRIEPLAGGITRLHTDGATIDAEKVVLAAGAWSARLLAPLGVSVPLETQRGYHIMVANANQMPSLPVVSADAKVYATPMEHGLRFAGTVEFAGLEAAPDYRRADALVPLAKDMFPGLEIDTVTRWMGHRPSHRHGRSGHRF